MKRTQADTDSLPVAKRVNASPSEGVAAGSSIAAAPTCPTAGAQPVACGSVTPASLLNAGWTYPSMPGLGMMPHGMMPHAAFFGGMPFFNPFAMPFPFWMPAAAAAAASAMMMQPQQQAAQCQLSSMCGAGALQQATPEPSTTSSASHARRLSQSSLSCPSVPAPAAAGSLGDRERFSPCPTPDSVCSPSVNTADSSSNNATDEEFHFFIDNFLSKDLPPDVNELDVALPFDDADTTVEGNALPRVDSLFGFFDDSTDACAPLTL